MVKLRKIDGTYSKTMVWNIVILSLTSLFTVAVAMLPELPDTIPDWVYLGLALAIKTVDLVLRQITSLPMGSLGDEQG